MWFCSTGKSAVVLPACHAAVGLPDGVGIRGCCSYADMIANSMEEFLKETGAEPEALVATLEAVRDRTDLYCLAYILASVDFFDFVALMDDMGSLYGWAGPDVDGACEETACAD
jgi:hypothetical protein